HPYWGPVRSLHVGHAADDRVRFQGSSGGGVSALAIFALRSGLVDRVVQVAADPKQPTGNLVVVSRTEAEILECAGSRYAPSSPLAGIEAVLAEGGKAAFIGKPCDASALRGLARFDERVARHIPLVLSFFCAGTPSRHGADRILAAMGVDPDQVTAFRYRGEGWPGRAKATLRSGEVRDMSYDESWGGYLADEVQFRCKICPDAVGGVADVVCADAWYGDERGYPLFEEQDGRSLFAVRTEIGERLLSQAQAAAAVVLQPLAIDEVERMQPGQVQRKRMIRARTAALAVLLRPRPHMHGLFVREAARRGRFREAARNFLGTIRRVVIRKL
ncbi:MAG TPA: Coenzyme F420 hydrogenase/dehydrogenase, beta subunit C-terminal domain, partial [Caulobacteraceae bacterium]|nr:Coenzyme F420 hydrogenase/dehydrogenase, beta subunit C-terminal domain [Caulobacteraceae bacterium]